MEQQPVNMKQEWFDFFMVLVLTIVTEALVFAFPRWGLSAALIIWTPVFQFGIGSLLLYLYSKWQKRKGRTVSAKWMFLVIGVPIAVDAYLLWFAAMNDM
ncbi:MAG: hypothetical protein ACXVOI_09765 [Tumebacillaceae bacterium]